MNRAAFGLALLLSAGAALAQGQAPPRQTPPLTFTNPILPSGPDPWVVRDGEVYYYMNTLGDRLDIWKTRDIADLAHAERKTVWTPPADGPNSVAIWAPELHRIDGRWFIYYTAAERGHNDDAHRGVFVLENDSADPLSGAWRDRGRLKTAHPGIDGTTFAYRGRRYFVYSPYVGADSDLAIAPMVNPWTLGQPEMIIARPDQPWERQGGRQILEGPEFLQGPRGDLFLTYSASACWSDDYALGLLSAKPGADPLDPHAWRKAPRPVLAKSAAAGVYATGHNGFFTSPDGKQHWIIYHGNSGPGLKCTPRRAPRIQPFTFDDAGRPQFGEPQVGPLPKPTAGDAPASGAGGN
jgi:GH43 family beta-xylosidase